MGDLKGEKEITRIRITGGAIFLGIIAAHQVEALAPASGCWTCRQRQTRGPWEVSGRDLRQVNTPGRMFRGEREPLTGEAREATSMRLGVEPCRFLWWELLMPQYSKAMKEDYISQWPQVQKGESDGTEFASQLCNQLALWPCANYLSFFRAFTSSSVKWE